MTEGMRRGQAAAEAVANQWLAAIERHKGKADNIARELCAIGFSNVSDYYNPDGTPKLLTELSPTARRAIKGIEQTKYGMRLLLWDKQDALWRLVELRGDKPAEKFTGKLDISWSLKVEGEHSGLNLEEEV